MLPLNLAAVTPGVHFRLLWREEGVSVMKCPGLSMVIVSAVVLAPALIVERTGAQQPAPIKIDYPLDGSLFPPDFAAPAFLWRDPSGRAETWRVDVTFSDGWAAIQAHAPGERLRVGEIDPRALAATNQAPKLTPE